MYVSVCAADTHARRRLAITSDIREIMALRATAVGYARLYVILAVSVISALWASDRRIHRSDLAVV